MTVQERASQRSVAQRIAELRRLREIPAGDWNLENTTRYDELVGGLLPVLLASWDVVNLEGRLHQVMDTLPEGGVRYKHPLYKEYNQLHKDLEAANAAYRTALKGVEDA